jgi:prevent-host-death family protein
MKKMPASAFKAKCLAVMDDIYASGESVIVTKRGKPLVQVMPVKKTAKPLLGRLKGVVEIVGDLRPIIPPEDWARD